MFLALTPNSQNFFGGVTHNCGQGQWTVGKRLGVVWIISTCFKKTIIFCVHTWYSVPSENFHILHFLVENIIWLLKSTLRCKCQHTRAHTHSPRQLRHLWEAEHVHVVLLGALRPKAQVLHSSMLIHIQIPAHWKLTHPVSTRIHIGRRQKPGAFLPPLLF